MKRTLASTLALGLLVGGLVLAGPTSASAAVPDFTPSSSNSKKFIISVLSSMLGPLTPSKWKREQIANQFQYNHSWEQMAVQTGIDPLDINYLNAPSTPDEYKLLHTEQQLKGGKMGKPFAAPATKLATFTKVASGVGAVLVSGEVGFMIGKQYSTAMGFNTEYGLCEPGYEDFGFISTITGTDCSGFYDFSTEYDPNGDVIPGASGANSCLSGHCIAIYGVAYSDITSSQNVPVVLWRMNQDPGNFNTAFPLWVYKDGDWYTPSITRPVAATWCANITASDQLERCQRNDGGVLPARYGYSLAKPTSPTFGIVPEENNPDPERVLSCSVSGSDGNTYTAQSSAYRESDGALPAPSCPDLPDGVSATGVKIAEESELGTKELIDEATTAAYQNWAEQFPECGTGACKLDLKKKTGGTVLPSCFDLQQECMDWFEQPNRDDLYQCTYGNDDVPLSECFVYSGVFKPERLAIGAPYSDPVTGEWSGGQSSPKAGDEAMTSTVQDPEFGRNCWTGGWAQFNPVEWVMQPVKCAWEWAMVPRTSVVELEFAKVSQSWSATPPGVVIATVSSWDLDLDLNGCSGFPITWQEQTTRFLDACPGSVLAPMAATARPIVSVVLTIGGILAIIAMVAGIIGYRGMTVSGGNH